MTEDTVEHAQPLTVLAEDEVHLPRQRPRVRRARRSGRSSARWTSTRRFPRALVDELFDLGVMGIEIPESLRRRRRHASSTRCSPSRSCRASIRRSASWWTCRTRSSSTRCCAGATTTSSGATCPKLASRHGRRLRAVGGRLRQRRVRADDARARGRRRLRPHRPQALDHQRQRGRPLHRLRDRQSRGRLPRHHGVPRRARHRRASRSARRKTSSASAPAARAS